MYMEMFLVLAYARKLPATTALHGVIVFSGRGEESAKAVPDRRTPRSQDSQVGKRCKECKCSRQTGE
jgi:hypothetical protein